ncbi:MAG TPA: ABC transporter permease, partial [Bacteroidales bacterium]|nr:ABC transporter permease [Bacteroidales bacterium]
MDKNFLKIFFRNIRCHKLASIINITGLVLGITSTVLILEYVFYERSFDSFHKNGNNIYRVVYNRYRGETLLWKTANSFFPTGKYMKDNFPEVKNFFNISRNYNIEVSNVNSKGDKISFFEEKAYYASTSIFDVLTIPLIQGINSCLSDPYTVVLSENASKKYFGNEDPMGKIIKVNNHDSYTVCGVYKNFPENSHIKSDLLFSFSTLYERDPGLISNWSYDYCHTYLQLADGTDYRKFEKGAFVKMIEDNYGESLVKSNERDEYILQPIRSIHLCSAIEYETEPPGNGRGVNILFGFSLFFLMIAWVNYINLVTAQSIERAKEIGIKKVNGISKRLLVGQFISEAFVFNLVCLAISIILIVILTPLFKQLTGIDKPGLVFNQRFLISAIIVFFSGVLISSIYPAFVLSSFQPLQILKGKYKNSKEGFLFRKGLVTFQLFVSISLLIGTVIIFKQVHYLMKKDLGYKYNSTMIMKSPKTNEKITTYKDKISLFRECLRQNPEVSGFTFISDVPGYEINNWFWGYRKGFDGSTGNAYFRTDIDQEFFRFFHIRLLAGSDFTDEDKVEQKKLIINVKALKRLGFSSSEEAVGQSVMNGSGSEYKIIGVVDDFNYYSSKVEAVPTIFTIGDNAKQYIAVRYNVGENNIQSLIKRIIPEYNRIFPGSAFEYKLLEDRMADDIKPDRTFSMVFGIFTVLAIIISIIGILGLLLITINQNIKELGVRKILGAEPGSVGLLLGKQLLWQLIIAILISLPVSYYCFQKLVLDNYVYRISISWE